MTALLVVIAIGLAIGLVVAFVLLQKAQGEIARARAEAMASAQRASAAEQRAAHLSRYEAIVDVERTAAQMRASAEQAARQIDGAARQDAQAMIARATMAANQADAAARATVANATAHANKLVTDAQKRSDEIAADAQREAQAMIARATVAANQVESAAKATVANATGQANKLVADAHKQADEIAADARRAIEEAKRLEATVRALKNVAEGYGDAYILPTAGLLDELAEHFGHTEAGEKLKAARKRTQAMVKGGEAATCDYVEASRREIAVRFVVDAFNGKVDTILADTKEDNFGTLAQKIRDAFALVNQNGAAFRNARINPTYLEARLDELKWAVVAHELRVREREEQRILKERIREEERAQREFERAQKEALKEEEVLRKAMEKARREVEQSSEADRARFEAQLRELAEKLKTAEEKNQRAISMAQQTKAGHVYVISNVGSFGEHVYKIGMTRRLEPRDRVRELGDASVPFEFDIHALIPVNDAPAVECALQKKFVARQVNKVNARKEFFRIPLEEIRAEVERLGIPVSWTMTAACREYQETLALERALERGEAAAAAWKDAQVRVIEDDAKNPARAERAEEELASV